MADLLKTIKKLNDIKASIYTHSYVDHEAIELIDDVLELLTEKKPKARKHLNAPPGFECIRARFIGKDGSCGFKLSHVYDLWMLRAHGVIYVSRRDLNSTAIPYETMNAFKKNLDVISEDDEEDG